MLNKLIVISVLTLSSALVLAQTNATSNASTSSQSNAQGGNGGQGGLGGAGYGGAGTGYGGAGGSAQGGQGGSAVGGGAQVNATTSGNNQAFTPTLNFNSPDVSTVNQNVSGTTTQNVNQTVNGTTNQNVTTNGTQTVNQNLSGTTTNNQNVTTNGKTTTDGTLNTTNTNIVGGVQTQIIDYQGSYTVKNVPSMNAPPLTTSNDTCMGSTSGSGAGPGWGLSFGTTWTDENCKRLKNGREMWNMGLKGAGLALLCQDAANRQAIKESWTTEDDYLCPQDREERKRAAAVTAPASSVAAGQAPAPAQWDKTNLADPYIAKRAPTIAAK